MIYIRILCRSININFDIHIEYLVLYTYFKVKRAKIVYAEAEL